jgi:hypothetical protein
MSLDIQVQILSVDTGNFYSNREALLHWLNHKLRIERSELKKKEKDIIDKLFKYGICESDLKTILNNEYDFNLLDDSDFLHKLAKEYKNTTDLIKLKNEKIKESKNKLLKLLSNKININETTNGKHHVRELRNLNPSGGKKDVFKYANEPFNDKKIISVFDSAFTRMIGAKQDELSEDFMVIQVYYFDIIKDLIYHGFTYKGEKYIYFTSSAGQIRTKKTVFIKESVWKQYEKTIMCGLTMDSINKKGGNNPNKHLAYMALTNSATDVWEEFDIDKSIVIDDFETDVFGTYDLVDDVDYSIKRVSDYVPITHTDGAGMMLPCAFGKEQKNQMVRLPWIKGLLGVFDFKKFIEVNGCSSKIEDIYGKTWDIIEDDIQVIFTKSQTKMWKYYDSWEQYKEYYKFYNCTAGYTNKEEDKIKDATINYQMLQTLTEASDRDIDNIIKKSNDKLKNLCSSVQSMKSAFGIAPDSCEDNMTYLQRAIKLYPDLMNDEWLKIILRQIKDSMVKNYKAGSQSINGKYTFLLPDFYAACEYWFMNNKSPNGLLNDQEVFCWLFRKSEELDCLRSPHLYKEHAIRKNIACNEYKERQRQVRDWFATDAIYTSCKDLISKILQFDVDGDKSLVVADDSIIEAAKKSMIDIVPLYYNMRKASPIQLNNKTIYDGLNAAFVGGNIGIYSNNISKIWNSDIFINGSDKDKQNAVDLVRLLCMENNFVIDFAKTLYKPERPSFIHDKITSFTNKKLPHFFTYAKDKTIDQVEDINNSFVNKLEYKIINPRINSRSIGLKQIDYTKLVTNPNIECRVIFNKNGKINEELSDPMIVKYYELNQKYHFKVNMECSELTRGDLLSNTQYKQDLFFKRIANEIRFELSKFDYCESEIVDILVKLLYHVKPSKHKSVLWFCYGRSIFENIEKNIRPKTKIIQCVDCGEWFETSIFDSATCRCSDCLTQYKKTLKKEQNRRAYEKRKGLSSYPLTSVNNQ